MPRAAQGGVITIGVFDGVHVAHQRLLRRVVSLARRARTPSLALTFDPDPQQVLDPAHAAAALMPIEERVARVRALDIEYVWIIPFTKAFARMRAEPFVQRVLKVRLRAATIVVGDAFVFGSNRRGDMELLRRLGPSLGIRVVSVPRVLRGGIPVSSSRIRRLIQEGRLAKAKALLGRPPTLYGRVVRGTGRGRWLGCRTANLQLLSQVLPPRGVYAVAATLDGSRRVRPGVMNLGVRPTFGPGPMVCEVHLLDFSGTLLNRRLSVSLLAFLRAERCFPSWEALRRQMARDIRQTRRLAAAA